MRPRIVSSNTVSWERLGTISNKQKTEMRWCQPPSPGLLICSLRCGYSYYRTIRLELMIPSSVMSNKSHCSNTSYPLLKILFLPTQLILMRYFKPPGSRGSSLALIFYGVPRNANCIQSNPLEARVRGARKRQYRLFLSQGKRRSWEMSLDPPSVGSLGKT